MYASQLCLCVSVSPTALAKAVGANLQISSGLSFRCGCGEIESAMHFTHRMNPTAKEEAAKILMLN